MNTRAEPGPAKGPVLDALPEQGYFLLLLRV